MKTLKIAVDLNAVPPLGIEGVEVDDAGEEREGVVVYGAFGVGNFKTKLHKACVARLFTRNDLVLDAEAIADVAREMVKQEAVSPVPRVAGIDPGTLSVDVCGLDDGRLFLDATWPTAELARGPAAPASTPAAGAAARRWWWAHRGTACRCGRRARSRDEELRLAFLAPRRRARRHRRAPRAGAPARRGGIAARCSPPA